MKMCTLGKNHQNPYFSKIKQNPSPYYINLSKIQYKSFLNIDSFFGFSDEDKIQFNNEKFCFI